MKAKVCKVRAYEFSGYGWACDETDNPELCVLGVGLAKTIGFSLVPIELKRLGYHIDEEFTDGSRECRAIYNFDAHCGDKEDLEIVRAIGEKLNTKVIIK